MPLMLGLFVWIGVPLCAFLFLAFVYGWLNFVPGLVGGFLFYAGLLVLFLSFPLGLTVFIYDKFCHEHCKKYDALRAKHEAKLKAQRKEARVKAAMAEALVAEDHARRLRSIVGTYP